MSAFSPRIHKLYHLGLDSCSRSSLARANEGTPPELFEKVFQALLARCQALAPPNQKFRFKDGGKGAVKIRVGVSAEGCLPGFVDMTAGAARTTRATRT